MIALNDKMDLLTENDICFYSRKSKFTSKGESTANQIEMGQDHALKHFGVNIKKENIFEDEGYSGGNVDRPEFKRMMDNIKKKKYKILICYRLDRISRNVLDFADIMEVLEKYDVAFISIRESFDTTTPMGRAMMYIASVFAQLERETAAERIRDNMIELAKTGRWLGGITPQGFKSEPIMYLDQKGKERTLYKLAPISDELKLMKLIYNKYLAFQSLTQLETYCLQENKKTRNNNDFSRFALRSILSNPVYAIADQDMYEYLVNNNYGVYVEREKFDGKRGVMAYNKTLQKKNQTNKIRDNSDWIIAVGKHKGTVPSRDWIEVQNLLEQNKSKRFRKVKNSESLLSGILRCSNCNSYMRPKMGRLNKEGEQIFYYMCELKEKSKKARCDMKNVQGNNLDKLVIEELKMQSQNESLFSGRIKNEKMNIETTQNSIKDEITSLENNIKNNEQAINNLVNSLAKGEETTASKYIMSKIEEMDKQNAKYKDRLSLLRNQSNNNDLKNNGYDIMKDMLDNFAKIIDTLDVHGKRNLIKGIVEKITWDGEFVDIVIFGAEHKKKEQKE